MPLKHDTYIIYTVYFIKTYKNVILKKVSEDGQSPYDNILLSVFNDII